MTTLLRIELLIDAVMLVLALIAAGCLAYVAWYWIKCAVRGWQRVRSWWVCRRAWRTQTEGK